MYYLRVRWNREFAYYDYDQSNNLNLLIKEGEEALMSGDGARISSYRIYDEDNNQVYPKPPNESPRIIDNNTIHKKYMDQELHLYKGWINAPSTLQPFHSLHGQNAVIAKIGDKCKAVLLSDLDNMSQFDIDERYLAIGDWHK